MINMRANFRYKTYQVYVFIFNFLLLFYFRDLYTCLDVDLTKTLAIKKKYYRFFFFHSGSVLFIKSYLSYEI